MLKPAIMFAIAAIGLAGCGAEREAEVAPEAAEGTALGEGEREGAVVAEGEGVLAEGEAAGEGVLAEGEGVEREGE